MRKHRVESVAHDALDRSQARLARPAAEARPVVLERELQVHDVGVESLDRSDGQRQSVDRTHDDSRTRVAPVLAVRPPDLTVHLDLTDGA